jgi:hypothetical protein
MTTDFRALCAELTDELADFQWAVIEAGVGWACPDTEALIDRARAALARGGHPAPVPVSEPIAWLWEYIGSDPYPHKFSPVARSLREMDPANPPFPDDWRPVAPLYLARWGHQPAPPAEGEQRHPTPVPVAERLPGPEDCDAGGRCWAWDWLAEKWCLCDRTSACHGFDYWLPATALPLPAGEVGK